jgi:DNA-binding SARP family transcriptional activator/Tfp pilus assembly protein PilF
MLGSLAVLRDGRALDLPASRKVRALLAYLALTPRATSRQRLCELLWETTADPRAELRWHLSKLRALIGAERINDKENVVRLDLADSHVDAREVQRTLQAGIASLEPQRVRELHGFFRGEFLEGLELDHCPEFMAWLLGQRRRFRDWRVALLERIVAGAGDEEALAHIEKWLEIAPFDVRAHQRLFEALARHGRFRECDEQLSVSTRMFRSAELDCDGLRSAWRASTAQRRRTPPKKPSSGDGQQAFDCYLLGRQHLARMMRQGLEQSRQMFDRSLELDPGYGPAWAGLATSHACMHEWFDTGKASLALADQASRRALEAAPHLAEAHVARGFVRAQSLDYGEAIHEFEKAIGLNPYLFDAYYYYARTAFGLGDMERAAEMFRLASQARPADFQSAILYGTAMRALGRLDEALEIETAGVHRAELVLSLNPGDGRALSLGAGALMDLGQADRSMEWANRALALYPDDTSALVNIACAHARANERGKALDLLERVFARGCGKRDWVLNDPDYFSLRGEPRFQRMLEQLK